jgi:predicted O-linked N-acetylglucosamine transferase (SPINDLY family)
MSATPDATPELSAEALRLAGALYERGDWANVEALCRQIVQSSPEQFEALELLGIVAARTRRADEAARLLRRAATVRPDDPSPHNNLGNVLKDLGSFEEALQSFDRALELNPGFAYAYNNRAHALEGLGRYTEALASYDRALELDPSLAAAHYGRAQLLQPLGRLEESLAGYERVLALRPDLVSAVSGRADVLRLLGRRDEAIDGYGRALDIEPRQAECRNSRGLLLRELGRFDEALEDFERADYAEACFNRAVTLRELTRNAEAMDGFERTLSIDPNRAEAYYNRGLMRYELGHALEALADLDAALDLQPDRLEFRLLWLHVKLQLCDWRELGAQLPVFLSELRRTRAAVAPFCLLALTDSPELMRAAAEAWVHANAPASTLPVIPKRRSAERIRLGYFSADFHNHATIHLAAELFERHDRNRFELVAFSFGKLRQDGMRQRTEAAFTRLLDVRHLADRDVALLARELGIDIAIDLKGFTHDARPGIFAQRAAPVQVAYLGFPATMGAPYIDYMVADAMTIPPASRTHYTESLVYLPHSYQVNDRQRPIAPRSYSRSELGLPSDGFVFCSFGRAWKISPEVFDVWMGILRRVDRSVLWLLDEGATAASNLRREAEARDVSGARLIFAPRLALAEHLARHRVADLFLDTLPCNAHTSASDALWAGVPVLTCTGSSFAARVAGSLLRAVGLPELIMTAAADYEAVAVELATQPMHLADLKVRLARARLDLPLFDSARLVRHLEGAYLHMLQRWQAGLAPCDIYA